MKNYLKIVVVFVLIISILTLTSCTQKEKSKNDFESIVTSFEHPQTKQKFKIVNAYKLYQNYADKVESNPKQSQLEIYNEEVIKPIYSACFENVEYPYMADEVLNVAPDLLTENQILSEEIDREETENIIKEALLKSSDLIPSEIETTACVFPATNTNIQMITVGAGKIIVLYSKYYTEDVLRSSMAHEYHHSVWTEKYLRNAPKFTVLDNLIFEGKAFMFEKLVYPDSDYAPIYSTFNKYYWSKIVLDLEKYDFNRSYEIILGGNGLPRRYGYSEGYKMVKSYLDLHPNVTPEEWTALSAKEIFEKGNYLENYK
ncbi:DUF2268 domain-containing putative Zn-dependent protease [Lysinibacillus xylanilyticus]|uniref:DUF2268 domain-containing putative Zn-dependent protease n=1 Tax=Lysinibacillus xylanilyticus TaxID=582475 RepID=UPI003806CABE